MSTVRSITAYLQRMLSPGYGENISSRLALKKSEILCKI